MGPLPDRARAPGFQHASQVEDVHDAVAIQVTPVVVPGNLPSTDGKYSLYCAVIVKRVDAKTRAKTALNDLLRNVQ